MTDYAAPVLYGLRVWASAIVGVVLAVADRMLRTTPENHLIPEGHVTLD